MKTALRLAAYLTHWNRIAFVAAGLTAGLGTALLTAVVSALPVSAFLPLDAFLITAAPAALVLFDLLFFLGLYRLRRQGRADYTLRMIPGGAHTYPLAVGLAALLGGDRARRAHCPAAARMDGARRCGRPAFAGRIRPCTLWNPRKIEYFGHITDRSGRK